MYENFILEMGKIQYGMIIVSVLINFMIGVLYFRNALRRRDLDLAFAIFISLYAFVLVYVPTTHYLWNYLAISWVVLLSVFVFKVYFGDLIREGTTKDKIFLVLGILLIVLILLFGRYIDLPEWVDYIPSF